MILLDTNVISEMMREVPDGRVAAWLGRQKSLHLAVTTITIAEIQRGLKRLPAGKRRKTLEANFADFISRGFQGRVIPSTNRRHGSTAMSAPCGSPKVCTPTRWIS